MWNKFKNFFQISVIDKFERNSVYKLPLLLVSNQFIDLEPS